MCLKFREGGSGVCAAINVMRVCGVMVGEIAAVYVGEGTGEVGVLAEKDGLVGRGKVGLHDDRVSGTR